MNQIPVATQWTLDASGDTGRSAITSVFMIICQKTGSKGSGFLIENGLIVTNEHVIKGCEANQITVVSACGVNSNITKIWIDTNKDLAILQPQEKT